MALPLSAVKGHYINTLFVWIYLLSSLILNDIKINNLVFQLVNLTCIAQNIFRVRIMERWYNIHIYTRLHKKE
jgi:hypothetical protein